jgi:fumarylacetoacetate (FAA) hydrolase family protein
MFRDKSDKAAGKRQAQELRKKVKDEKKRLKQERKARKKAAGGAAVGDDVKPPRACQDCHQRKVKAKVVVDGQVRYYCL